MRGLSGKRILIAGAGTGIGRGLAIRLAEEGAQILAADINETSLPETAELAKAAANAIGSPGTVKTHLFDLADAQSITSLVEACQEKLGGLDGVAIAAAEVGLQAMRADVGVPNADPAIWQRVMHVNVINHMMLMQTVLPLLKAAGGGSIVSLSSNSAYLGRHSAPAYATSKAGLHALVRHLARIGGVDGIRCNGIAPGLTIDSGRELPDSADKEAILDGQCIKRLGRYGDQAAAIAFLLSDDAAWITGQILSVNGGLAFRD